jgi:SAM-dependent methyltransferase
VSELAEAYDRHVGRYGAQLAAELIHVAGLRGGQRTLDVGCGPGALTRALADTLDAGHVAAVDPSEAFVAACRERVPGADVRVGVGERLPFDDDAFDAVLAQLVVQLMDDREVGLREMVRVARPGGVVAACVWDSTTMPVLRSFWDAAHDIVPERTAELDEASQVGYGTPPSSPSSGRQPGYEQSLPEPSSSEPTTRASMISCSPSPPVWGTPAPCTPHSARTTAPGCALRFASGSAILKGPSG